MPRRRHWGAGTVVPPAHPGGPWAIRWREGGRRRYRGHFPTQDLARQALDAIKGDIARDRSGLPLDPRSVPPLATLAEAWLTRRDRTHRNAPVDRARWKRDLAPTFGRLRARDVTQATIRAWVEERLASGLSPASVRLGLRLLSSLWSDLAERPRETGATTDPTKRLPQSIRRLVRPTHDPRLTPFLQTADDVRRVASALPEGSLRVAFSVGALAGLRTGEVIGLSWGCVDLDAGRLVVREQVHRGRLGPLKDSEPRLIPLAPQLVPLLKAHRLATGGRGLLFRPARPGLPSGPSLRPARFVRPQTLSEGLRAALVAAKLPRLTWYQATRHTFASQRAAAGVPLARIAEWLGHSSLLVTQRYAHLVPGGMSAEEIGRGAPELGAAPGAVKAHPATQVGQKTGSRTRHEGSGRTRKGTMR